MPTYTNVIATISGDFTLNVQPLSPPPPPSNSFLLLEDGVSFFLIETGDKLILE